MLSLVVSVFGLIVAFAAGVIIGCVVVAVVFDALHRRLLKRRARSGGFCRTDVNRNNELVQVSGDGWVTAQPE